MLVVVLVLFEILRWQGIFPAYVALLAIMLLPQLFFLNAPVLFSVRPSPRVCFVHTLRVVSTMLGMHAEYEVCVKGGGRRWSKWQRFSKFKMIAECTQGDPDTAAAWSRVLRAKPHYRCLNPDYLAQKCNLLEVVSYRK